MAYKTIIYGLGAEFAKLYNSLKYLEFTKQIEIVALAAKDIPIYNKINEYRIIPKYEIKNMKYDFIFVMSSKYFNDIRQELVMDNISEDRIVSCNILYIANLNLNKYFMLKQRRISIISNNCWGGIVYNTLGMKCLSPFKNLFLNDEDYLKMLSNLSYYMKIEPRFIREDKDLHSGLIYPVLGLEDIEIHCNHDTQVEGAIENWNRRRNYINYRDLFVEMYTIEKENARKFDNLTMFRNKVCFVPYKQQLESEMTLRLLPGQKEFWEVVNSSAGKGANSYTYSLIDLLNGNRIYRVEN